MPITKTMGNFEVIFPDELKFESGATIPSEDASIRPVYNLDNELVAVNIIADVEDSGTVINHIMVDDSFGTFHPNQGIGKYNDDEENYEHPDDVPYDTVNQLSEETLNEIQINNLNEDY